MKQVSYALALTPKVELEALNKAKVEQVKCTLALTLESIAGGSRGGHSRHLGNLSLGFEG